MEPVCYVEFPGDWSEKFGSIEEMASARAGS